MLYRLFYILAFLSQYIVGYEIDEYEVVIPETLSSSDENQDDVLWVMELSDTNQDFMEYEELVDNEDSFKEIPTDAGISFIGPVKAKGSVSMAATFGYDSAPHTSYPPGFSFSSSWFPPPINPQQFFAPSPLFTPIPFAFSHIPLLSMFLPEMGNIAFIDEIDENLLREKFDTKIDSKEIFLKITPLINEDSGSSGNTVELLSSEEAPAPVVFLDEDFPDYEAVDQDVEDMEDIPFNDDPAVKETAGGAVFGGFVPAKGSVKIAARF